MLIANSTYRERFGGARPPLELGEDEDGRHGLDVAKTMAWRDGAGCVAGVRTKNGMTAVEVERVGLSGDLLLWRFPRPTPAEPLSVASKWLSGATGERLASAGVLAALVGDDGKVIAANRLFAERALTPGDEAAGHRFGDLVEVGDDGHVHLATEGEQARSLRMVHVPVDPKKSETVGTFLLFDQGEGGEASEGAHLQALLDVLPIGLALVDRDGRFLTMNNAFRRPPGSWATSRRSIPATSWSRKTRRRSPMQSAAMRAGRPCRATLRFAWSASRPSRSR